MKNSMKQMLRTPIRTILFLLLMVFAVFLMAVGACIWLKTSRTMAQYEERFITIGTVRQIPDSFEQTLRWNAETEEYDVVKKAQYSSYYTPEDLLFPGAKYIAKPEQRAFYASCTPEYLKLWRSLNGNAIAVASLIVEFSPVEDCVPDESVQIYISKVIGGDQRMEGVTEWFCDHRNPEPEMLYQDKTYAAVLDRYLYIHGSAYDELMKNAVGEVRIGMEYIPGSLDSNLYLPDGSMVEDVFRDGQKIFEVTEGFYESDAGRRLLNLAKMEGIYQYMQPVTGTNKTCLLMPFYNGDAYISEGRDISEEEYAKGDKVCLAPGIFMKNNGLSLGDKIHVELMTTDTERNAGRRFLLDGGLKWYGGMVDAEGKPLEVFEKSDYTVVGIYDVAPGNTDSIFNPGADELIVPMESISARDGKNLVSCGPMTDATASFQIPNGTIDEFLKGWAAYGTDGLEFSFYDRGYSRLKAGMDNMRNMSLLFLTAGMLLTGLLLLFFSHLFITKQAERTAIERSLGMSSMQCRWSILSGFLLLVLAGSVIGSAAGVRLSADISAEKVSESYYDTSYTVGTANTAGEISVEEVQTENAGLAGCLIVVITAAGAGIALGKMNRSLKREPMRLLAERREE